MDTANSNHAPKKKVAWSKGDKALMIGMVILIGIVTGVALWYKTINAIPTVSVPMPTMPSANAFDYFVAASNAVTDSSKIGFAISKNHTPDSSNPDDRDYSLTEKQAIVRENADPLRTLRTGFAYPYQNPPMRSFNALFPYYAKFRGTARLLALEGQAKDEQGDWSGAVSADLDAVQMGEMIPHGSPLIGDLVGIACQAIGRRPIWNDVDHLNAAQSEASARRLEKIQTLHVPFADVLQEEKWGGQAGLMEIMQKPGWRGNVKSLFGDGSDSGFSRQQQIRLYFISNKTMLDNYTQYMDKTIANTRQPYALSSKLPTLAIPSDPLSQIMLPVFEQARFKDIEGSMVQNRLLTVTLALRAYHLEHGAYPTTLSALVPKYLTHIPDDPFAKSGPLQYKLAETGYLLYSIGPDGTDNGGKPVFDPTKPAPESGGHDQRYNVNADSKGDIVAGINTM